MADPDSIADARRRAQAVSMQAQRARVFELHCAVCHKPFISSFVRATCGEACWLERRREQGRAIAKRRTPEERRAERQRMAQKRGKPYRTSDQRMADAAERERLVAEKRAVAELQRQQRPHLTAEQQRERARLGFARRYKANPERERARAAAYKRNHPEKRSDWNHRRRVMMKAGLIAPVDLERIRDSRKSCVYCTAKLTPDNRTVDHILAVALGGAHIEFNLIPCCRDCNSRKGDRSITEWLALLPPERRHIVSRLYATRGLMQPLLPLVIGNSKLNPIITPKDKPHRCGCWASRGIICRWHTRRQA